MGFIETVMSMMPKTLRHFLLCCLTAFFAYLSSSVEVSAQTPTTQLQPKYYWSFDKDLKSSLGGMIALKKSGARLIADGLFGGAVSLSDEAFLRLEVNSVLSTNEGSIVFWVRPHWDDYGEKAAGSHTFLSYAWEGVDNAYGVLSDGWWEADGGQPFTYFIFNNQLRAKAEKRVAYRSGEWMQFVCTWSADPVSSTKLYVNGLIVGESSKALTAIRKLKSGLIIGADLAAPLSATRFADSDFDELAIFDRALSATEVRHLFVSSIPKGSQERKVRQGQIRAIFDEGIGWMTDAGARETIRRIKQAGFNVYIPCVWHGMGSRYPTDLAPAEIDTKFTDGDPLVRLIELAHAEGIQVHPWFTVTLRQRDFLSDYYDAGSPAQAFDVHNQRFRDFIVQLMLDVVKRYDVDGLSLDYIRSMGFCTSMECQQDYRERYDRDLLVDVLKAKTRLGLENALQRWNETAVEEIVKKFSLDGKKLRSSLEISIAGAPVAKGQSPNREGRNEVRWAENGYIDVIYYMDYGENPDFERMELVRSELNGNCRLLPLLGNYSDIRTSFSKQVVPRAASTVSGLIEHSLLRSPEGFGLYLYSQLDDLQIKQLGNLLRRSHKEH